jgi:hypothetical protein
MCLTAMFRVTETFGSGAAPAPILSPFRFAGGPTAQKHQTDGVSSGAHVLAVSARGENMTVNLCLTGKTRGAPGSAASEGVQKTLCVSHAREPRADFSPMSHGLNLALGME